MSKLPKISIKKVQTTKDYLKIGEASKILGVSIDTLRRWEKAGKIQATRTPGGTRLYSIETLKKSNPSAVIEPQANTLSTEELLNKTENQIKSDRSEYLWISEPVISDTNFPISSDLSRKKSSSLLKKIFLSSVVTSFVSIILVSLIVSSYISSPKAAKHLFGNNPIFDPLNKAIEEIIAIIDPPPLSKFETKKLDSRILAVTASSQFLEINSDTQINGALSVADAINDLQIQATPSASTLALISGDTTLTVTKTTKLDQDVSTAASPAFSALNLSATSNQLVLQSGGSAGTLTWTPTAARTITLPDVTTTLAGTDNSQTLTNKSLSGSSNTFTNIPNSALSNKKVTVSAGTNLSGGGDVELGSSISLSLKDSPSIAGTLTVAGATTLSSTLATTGATTLSSTLAVTGATTLSSTLAVSGTTALSGATTLSSTLDVTGNTTLSGTLATTGAATFSSTINSNTFTSTALTLSGSNPVISASISGSSLTINPGSTGALILASGSSSNGCTIDSTNGNLTCAGSISGSGSSQGFFTRANGLIYTSTISDSLYTQGNLGLGTTGSAKLTVAGNVGVGVSFASSVIPSNGLAVEGNVGIGTSTADYNLSVIGTGNFTGNVGIGNSLTISGLTLANGGISTTAINASSLVTSGNVGVGGSITGFGNLNGLNVSGFSTLSGLSATDINSSTLTTTGNVGVGGSLTVTSNATFNGGITLATGQLLSVNGDTFSDLTGTNLSVSSGQLNVVANPTFATSVTTPNLTLSGNNAALSFTGSTPSITSGANSFSIFSGGNVGIGTSATLGSTFNVNGNQIIGSSFIGASAPANGLAVSGNVGVGTTTANSKLVVVGGATIGTDINLSAPTSGLFVQGNVGIGATTSSNKLDVWGNARITGTLTVDGNTTLSGTLTVNNNIAGNNITSNSQFLASDGNTGAPGYAFTNDADSGLWRIGTNQIALTTAGSTTSGLSINGSGNVGIGTTSAAQKFHVNSTSGFVITSAGNVGLGVTSPNALLDIKATQTSGTILNMYYAPNTTLTGSLTGASFDLNDGNVTPTNQDITGLIVKLPTTTNTNSSGTVNLRGLYSTFGAGAGINQNGAGATIYSAAEFVLPALTQTSGTISANGILVSTPSQITTGGTGNGININATGVGAGTLNGVNISTITGSGGTETALNVGTGWDSVLKVGSTTIINGSGVTQVAGGGTGFASYTTGDILYASGTTTLTNLGIGTSGQVLTTTAGVPVWATISGSSCTTCLINNPTSTAVNTISPTGQTTTGLSVRQTSTASPTNNIFEITDSAGSTKYFYVDKDGNVSTGAIANTTLTLTPTSDTTALTLNGTNVATSKLAYMNAANTSGTIFDISYGTPVLATGSLTGQTINLGIGSTNQSVTGEAITLPSTTNTGASTYNLKGLTVANAGGINNTGSGTTNIYGLDITSPAITQTAGAINSYGVNVTTPTSITTGGTAYGVNIASTGTSVGTLYGLNIGNITAGAGTEKAITIGTGWDYGIFSQTTNNSYFAGNLGIGTSDPSNLLQVNSGTSTTFINSAGNLGVGATTSSNKLDVWGNARVTGTLTVDGNFSLGGTNTGTQFLANDGNAGAPGYAFTNDTDSGLWRIGTNQIALTTGGSTNNGLSINSSGNVGIGTTNATGILHVVGGEGTAAGITLNAGASSGASTGGTIAIAGGAGGATGAGGTLTLNSGAGGSTSGNSGAITIQPGTVTSGAGGAINITGRAGVGSNNVGSAITLTAGASVGSGTAGAISLSGGTGTGTGGTGGALSLTAGSMSARGTGANVTITSGGGQTDASNNASGGSVNIVVGAGVATDTAAITTGNFNVSFNTATGTTTTQGGNIVMTAGQSIGNNFSGGTVTISGGIGATADGSGGASTFRGGAGTGAGTGGAVNLTSGAGGTSGQSGSVTIASGAVTAGSAQASGAVTMQSAAGASHGGGTTGGASGAITIRSQAGGASNTGTGGASGALSISTGNGGAVTSSTGTGGAAGTLSITGGTGGGSNAVTGGAGASINLTAGNGGNGSTSSGAAGALTLTSGSAGTGGNVNGGNITLKTGTASGTGLAGSLVFQTSGANTRMIIDSGGNVGIGTSTPGTARLSVMGGNVGIGSTSPNSTLEVVGTTNITGNTTIGGTLGITGDTTLTGDLAINGGDLTTTATTFNLLNTTATTLNLGGAATSLTVGATTGTAVYRNATSSFLGNVGIGGSNPTQTKLAVAGNVGIGVSFGFNASAPVNGLAVEGNVGIGTTTANFNLSVIGTGNFTGNVGIGNSLTVTGLTLANGGISTTAINASSLVTSGNVGVGGSLTVTSNATFNGGITLATGQLLSINGDTFSDLTGTNLEVSSGALSVAGNPTFATSVTTPNLTLTGNNAALSFTGTTPSITSGANSFSIFSGGNVGIGTSATLGSLFNVNGNQIIGSSFTGGSAPANGLAVSGNVGIGTTTANSNLSVNGSAHIGGLYQGISAPANGLFVDGNVGIGATTSSNKLDVWGNARITETLVVDSTGTLGAGLIGYSGVTAPSSGLAVSGNVGVGTTSPLQALHVVGQCVTGDTKLKRKRKALRVKGKVTGTGPDPKNTSKVGSDSFEVDSDEWEDVRIDQIQPGDEILTLDEKTGEFVPSEVKGLMDMGIQQTFLLITESGKQIRTTANHPYFVKENRDPAIIGGVFEVDQSPKLEQLSHDSFIALANKNTHFIIKISKKYKKQLYQKYQDRNKQQFFAPDTFARAINILLSFNKIQPFELKIDNEYTGYEARIREIIARTNPNLLVSYRSLGHSASSYAHWAAYRAFKSEYSVDLELSSKEGKVAKEKDRGTQRVGLGIVAPIPLNRIRNTRDLMAGEYHKLEELSTAKWVKVYDIKPGMEIATTGGWERVISLKEYSKEQVWDIEIDYTHNFVGNNIVAHNTYINSGLNIGAAFTGGAAVPSNGLAISGNVGIGTTSPNYKLEVVGTTNITGALTVGGATTLSSTLSLADGSATTPALNFTNDTDSGLWRIGDNKIALTTGGNVNNGLTINSSGNVGIGTTNPTSNLHISSTSTSTATGFSVQTDNAFVANPSSSSDTEFVGQRITLDTGSGNVALGGSLDSFGNLMGAYIAARNMGTGTVGSVAGVLGSGQNNSTGTVTSAYGTVGRVANWNASGTITDAYGLYSYVWANNGTIANRYGLYVANSSTGASSTNNYGGYIAAQTAATNNVGLLIDEATGTKNTNLLIGTTTIPTGSYSIFNASTDANYFRGNLGIGTSSPGAKLAVAGGGLFGYTGTEAAPNNGLAVSGNVGIGTTSPNYKLEVVGNTNIAGNLTVTGSQTFSGALSLSDGSAGTPALNFTNDTDTGLYRIDSDRMSLVTGGASRLTINSGGNVGVGTTSPGALFDVNGTARVTTLQIGGAFNFASKSGSDPDVTVASGFQDILLTNTGTTYVGGSSTSVAKLTVKDGFTWGTALGLDATGETGGRIWNVISTGGDAGEGQGLFLIKDQTGDAIRFAIDTGGNVGVGYAAQTQGRLTVNGNVGIGTSTPGSKLQVNGAGVIGFGGAPFAAPTGGLVVGGNVGIGTSSPNNKLSILGTADIFGGNLGIGTSSPGAKLAVAGGGLFGYTGTEVAPTNGLAVSGNLGIGTTTANSNLSINGNAHIGSLYQGISAPTDGLFVDGNVGIGATTSSNKLDVWGNARVTGTLTVDSTGTFGNGLFGYSGVAAPAGGLAVSGNVGVGTTSPLQALHVVGQCVAEGTRIRRRRKGKNGEWIEEEVPVEDIRPDDEVLSLNEKTGKFEWHVVEKTMDMGIQEVFRLETEEGKWIETTANHPYLVKVQKATKKSAFADFGDPTKVGSNLAYHLINNIPQNNLNVKSTNQTCVEVAGFAPAEPWMISQVPYSSTPTPLSLSQITTKWVKVSQLKTGMEIATVDGWEKIIAITPKGRIQTYDLQIEGTHNFVGNNIVAHNTYINSGLNIGAAFTGGAAVPSNGLAVQGNIGIGTTTANSTLSVSGNAHIGSLYQSIPAPSNGLFVDGNVGIGATTSSNKLDVWGNARITGTLTVDGNTTLGGTLTPSGQILAIDGTAALPGYAFANDIDSGLWRIGANQIALTTGGGSHLGLAINSSGNVGIGNTSPSQVFQVNPNGSSSFVITSTGNVGIGFTTPGAPLSAYSQTITSGKLVDINTLSSNTLTTGTMLNIASTATSLSGTGGTGSLMNLSWAPGGSTIATGDLFALSIGANGTTTGNLFNILDSGSSIFSISESAVTTSLPVNFTSPGDVAIAYDINFTNPTASYIKSAAPLYIIAGETFNSSDLNLQTYNSGNIIFTVGGSGNVIFTSGGNVGIGSNVTTPTSMLSVAGNIGIGVSFGASSVNTPLNGLAVQGNVGIGTTTSNSTLTVAGNAHIGSSRGGITAPTDGLFVDGNVGIGATTSSNKLDVWGNTRFTGTLTVDSAVTFNNGLFGYSGATAPANGLAVSGNVGIGTTTANSRLTVNGSVTIGSGFSATAPANGLLVQGNVGIGFTSPGSKLDVFDTTSSSDVDILRILSNVGGTGTVKFRVDSDGDVFSDGGTAMGTPADVAENYPVLDENIEAGDIVTTSDQISEIKNKYGEVQPYIQKSEISYQNNLIGIISTKPGVLLSANTEGKAVALSGRIPTKVSTENGSIKIGDYLTSSSTPGVAMKATRPGQVVGKALESFDQVDATIVGKILTFVNVSFADPGNFLASLSMDDEGNLIMPKIKVAKLSIDPSVATASSQLSINNGQLAISSDPNYTSTTPQTVADNSSSLDVSSELTTLAEKVKSQESRVKSLEERLALLEATRSAVIPLDSSPSAQNDNPATSSATPSANLAEATSSATSSSSLASNYTLNPIPSTLNLTPPDILFATGSATLANLSVHSEATVSGMLTAYKLNVSEGFKSFGTTSLGNTTVAGNLSVDGTLSIENGSEINVIGTLYLQKSILAQKLDIFNGAVIVDKTGKLVAQTISAREYQAVAGVSAGAGTISAQSTYVTIYTEIVKAGSRILVTPTTQITQTLAVTNKTYKTSQSDPTNPSFTISIPYVTTKDITFDWWIVNEVEPPAVQ